MKKICCALLAEPYLCQPFHPVRMMHKLKSDICNYALHFFFFLTQDPRFKELSNCNVKSVYLLSAIFHSLWFATEI